MPFNPVATSSSLRSWRLSLLLTAFAIAVTIFPLWIIQPFKMQSSRLLPVALAAFRFGPWITLACLIVIACIAAKSFQLMRQRIITSICLLVIAACTLITHTNVFEKMFHPAGDPVFVPAASLALADSDALLSATLNGETHAYPVLQIAYHHVINDRLGGEPIVATY